MVLRFTRNAAIPEVYMSEFQLVTRFEPAGDQPEAIRQLVEGIEAGLAHQTLLGVTGSGKTFSIANVIAQVPVSYTHLTLPTKA